MFNSHIRVLQTFSLLFVSFVHFNKSTVSLQRYYSDFQPHWVCSSELSFFSCRLLTKAMFSASSYNSYVAKLRRLKRSLLLPTSFHKRRCASAPPRWLLEASKSTKCQLYELIRCFSTYCTISELMTRFVNTVYIF